MAIVSHFPGGKGGNKPINELYSYSSSNQPIDDGDGNWRVKFLSSGTLTVAQDMLVDVFAVGGGGNGADGKDDSSRYYGGGGGGGGYTTTVKNIKLEKGKTYSVIVGAANGTSSLADGDGMVFCEAAGGSSATDGVQKGADGGSGGGSGVVQGHAASKPGSDGGDGATVLASTAGGKGQGKTTREFGESTGDLYAGGGGGGGGYAGNGTAGAEGGGGDGGSQNKRATAGGENTGGGGGGGASDSLTSSMYREGAAGGSGIVIIRNARIATA